MQYLLPSSGRKNNLVELLVLDPHPTSSHFPGRVAHVPEELALSGEHLFGARHQAAAACRVQDVYSGGQVVEGDHVKGQQDA